jgi:hypothetical protein
VNEPQCAAEPDGLRTSVVRGRPFGMDSWSKRAAQSLDLEFTLRPHGRGTLQGGMSTLLSIVFLFFRYEPRQGLKRPRTRMSLLSLNRGKIGG